MSEATRIAALNAAVHTRTAGATLDELLAKARAFDAYLADSTDTADAPAKAKGGTSGHAGRTAPGARA